MTPRVYTTHWWLDFPTNLHFFDLVPVGFGVFRAPCLVGRGLFTGASLTRREAKNEEQQNNSDLTLW